MKTTLHIALISLLLLSACPALAAVTGIRYDQPVAYTRHHALPVYFRTLAWSPRAIPSSSTPTMTRTRAQPRSFTGRRPRAQLFNTASGVSVTWVPPANSEGETFAVSCIMGDGPGPGNPGRDIHLRGILAPPAQPPPPSPPATCIVSRGRSLGRPPDQMGKGAGHHLLGRTGVAGLRLFQPDHRAQPLLPHQRRSLSKIWLPATGSSGSGG